MLKYNWILNHSPNLAKKNWHSKHRTYEVILKSTESQTEQMLNLKIDLLLNFKLEMI